MKTRLFRSAAHGSRATERGVAVIIVLALIAVLMILVASNVRALQQLQRELRLVEHKHLQRREASGTRTNAITPVRFAPEQH
jgi:type II secretory pathway component PulK